LPHPQSLNAITTLLAVRQALLRRGKAETLPAAGRLDAERKGIILIN